MKTAEIRFVLSRTKDTHNQVFYTSEEAYEMVSEILKKENYNPNYVRVIVVDEDTLKIDYGSYSDFFYIKAEYDGEV